MLITNSASEVYNIIMLVHCVPQLSGWTPTAPAPHTAEATAI